MIVEQALRQYLDVAYHDATVVKIYTGLNDWVALVETADGRRLVTVSHLLAITEDKRA